MAAGVEGRKAVRTWFLALDAANSHEGHKQRGPLKRKTVMAEGSSKRGFAAMDEEERREISRKGGEARARSRDEDDDERQGSRNEDENESRSARGGSRSQEENESRGRGRN